MDLVVNKDAYRKENSVNTLRPLHSQIVLITSSQHDSKLLVKVDKLVAGTVQAEGVSTVLF